MIGLELDLSWYFKYFDSNMLLHESKLQVIQGIPLGKKLVTWRLNAISTKLNQSTTPILLSIRKQVFILGNLNCSWAQQEQTCNKISYEQGLQFTYMKQELETSSHKKLV